ncbi:hypothetical protein HfxHF1_485 [Halophage HF1]|uniref:Uncharacterized protein n=1 Tax=Halophage HF1 TaxID=2847106 RepID=A0A6B9PCT2_9CAUD|nr:hypothetical protein HfxHF1_485 [Halophage HF1]QHD55936.1 hypothetical protein HfxHF1_485 [Halophage HF1]
MVRQKQVLLIPLDYESRPAGRYDEVRESEDVSSPKVIQELVPDDGETSVDRAFVNDDRKTLVAGAIADYEAEKAKDAPDVAVQLDALERAVSYMWDVVSGEDVGSEAKRAADLELAESDETTDDSTSA